MPFFSPRDKASSWRCAGPRAAGNFERALAAGERANLFRAAIESESPVRSRGGRRAVIRPASAPLCKVLSLTLAFILQISNAAPVAALPALPDPPVGKVKDNAGVGSNFRPAPDHPGKSAYIHLHHIRQEAISLCHNLGDNGSGLLWSENQPSRAQSPQRRAPLTIPAGHSTTTSSPISINSSKESPPLGCAWRFGSFPLTEEGFRTGLAQVKSALDHGNPPLVDTSLYGDHTFVVCGYDEAASEILIMDPNIPTPGLRVLTDAEFERVWNSDGVNYHYRAAVFTSGRPRDQTTHPRQ